MGVNTLLKLAKEDISFSFRKELDTCIKNGLINFKSNKYSAKNSSWDGKKLTIPAYGIYEVSWGFKQNSLDTFYNDDVAKLSLHIDTNEYESFAVISKDTPSYYGVKSSSKTVIILLRENQKISLHAEILKKENPKMKDIYFSVLKLETEQSSKFGYET